MASVPELRPRICIAWTTRIRTSPLAGLEHLREFRYSPGTGPLTKRMRVAPTRGLTSTWSGCSTKSSHLGRRGASSGIAISVSARYDFSPSFALRGGVNTGFRAPSLHQLHYSKIDTLSVESPDGSSVLAEVGTFPNNSPIVQALDVPPLKQETSVNFSGGAVVKLGQTASLTVDAFRVTVDDRIVMSANFTADAVESTAPTVAAVMRDTRIQGAQFFANAARTATSGMEFTLNSVHAFRNGGVLDWGVSGAYFDTVLEGDLEFPASLAPIAGVLFEPADRAIIEDFQPSARMQGTVEYRMGPVRFGGGLRYFGSYTLWDQLGLIGRSQNQTFTPKTITDAHFAVRLHKNAELMVGANNLFNVYPDLNEFNDLFGTFLSEIAGAPFSNITDRNGLALNLITASLAVNLPVLPLEPAV